MSLDLTTAKLEGTVQIKESWLSLSASNPIASMYYLVDLRSGLRTHGFMGLWVYGFMGLWVYGYMGLWVYGFICLWVYGYTGFSTFLVYLTYVHNLYCT